MALLDQTSQLSARTFGRSTESAGDAAFLKGNPAQGPFGQFSQVDEEGVDSLTSGFDMLKKKMKQVDDAEKKLFREQTKIELKKMLMSSSGIKELLGTRDSQRETLQTKDFSEELPTTAGITNPLDVSRAAIGQQQGIGRFVENASNLAESSGESVMGILDRLGNERQNDYDNARQSLSDLLTVRGELRAEESHERAGEAHKANLQQTQLQMAQLRQTLNRGGLSGDQLVNIYSDLSEQGWDASGISTLLNETLGIKGNIPLVGNATGFGYVPGERTFYNRDHKGVDIIAPAGSPVHANVDMTVEKVFVGPEGGLQVYGRDAQGNLHRYLHLGGTRVDLKPGEQIKAGQVFATIGTPKQFSPTELSTAPHLDYSVLGSNGQWVKPVEGAKSGNFNPEQRSALDTVFARARDNKAAMEAKKAQAALDLKVKETMAIEKAKAGIPAKGDKATTDLAKAGNQSLKQVKDNLYSPDGKINRGSLAAANIPGIPGGRKLNNSMQTMLAQYVFMLSGKSTPTDQLEKFDQFLPKTFDSQSTIDQKIGNFQFVFDNALNMGLDQNILQDLTPEELNAIIAAGGIQSVIPQ